MRPVNPQWSWPTSAKVAIGITIAAIWFLYGAYSDSTDSTWRDCQTGNALPEEGYRTFIPAYQQSAGFEGVAEMCLGHGRAQLACELIRVTSHQIEDGTLRMSVLSVDDGWVEMDPARLDWRPPPDAGPLAQPDPWAEELSEIMFLVQVRPGFANGEWDRAEDYVDAVCR